MVPLSTALLVFWLPAETAGTLTISDTTSATVQTRGFGDWLVS
jgi:hypothetical protein